MMDGSKSFLLASPAITFMANCTPKMEWMMARISGIPKKIPIWRNSDLFIIFSSHPIFLSMLYRCLLSELSVSCFKAKIAELAIRNIIPK